MKKRQSSKINSKQNQCDNASICLATYLADLLCIYCIPDSSVDAWDTKISKIQEYLEEYPPMRGMGMRNAQDYSTVKGSRNAHMRHHEDLKEEETSIICSSENTSEKKGRSFNHGLAVTRQQDGEPSSS